MNSTNGTLPLFLITVDILDDLKVNNWNTWYYSSVWPFLSASLIIMYYIFMYNCLAFGLFLDTLSLLQ